MKNRSDVRTVFSNFYNKIKTQFDVGIKRFQSDNAEDIFNQFPSPFFQKYGIIHECSCVSRCQQKGVTERKKGHLLATTRASLFHKNVPKQYWGEVVLTVAHLINKFPTKALSFKSPMESLTKYFPNFSASKNLTARIFISVAFVHVHSKNKKTWSTCYQVYFYWLFHHTKRVQVFPSTYKKVLSVHQCHVCRNSHIPQFLSSRKN